jgi:hypothetical protein
LRISCSARVTVPALNMDKLAAKLSGLRFAPRTRIGVRAGLRVVSRSNIIMPAIKTARVRVAGFFFSCPQTRYLPRFTSRFTPFGPNADIHHRGVVRIVSNAVNTARSADAFPGILTFDFGAAPFVQPACPSRSYRTAHHWACAVGRGVLASASARVAAPVRRSTSSSYASDSFVRTSLRSASIR